MSKSYNLSDEKINELQNLVERMENLGVGVHWEAMHFLYDNNLIILFNWSEWDEGRDFFMDDDPNKYNKIDRNFTLRLLTAIARNDRFCTGAWDAIFESGDGQNLFKRLLETYQEKPKTANIEGEYKKIYIHEQSFGPNIGEILELYDITINIHDLVESEIQEVELGKHVIEPDESFMSISCKGLREEQSTTIDFGTFNRYWKTIESINFEKIYYENSGDGYDGGDLMVGIIKREGFLSYEKQIVLFSPRKDESTPETNKLLKVYEEIKRLPGYKEYYKRIKAKRKRLERKYKEAE